MCDMNFCVIFLHASVCRSSIWFVLFLFSSAVMANAHRVTDISNFFQWFNKKKEIWNLSLISRMSKFLRIKLNPQIMLKSFMKFLVGIPKKMTNKDKEKGTKIKSKKNQNSWSFKMIKKSEKKIYVKCKHPQLVAQVVRLSWDTCFKELIHLAIYKLQRTHFITTKIKLIKMQSNWQDIVKLHLVRFDFHNLDRRLGICRCCCCCCYCICNCARAEQIFYTFDFTLYELYLCCMKQIIKKECWDVLRWIVNPRTQLNMSF